MSKVAVIKCESIDTGDVESAVRRGVGLLGGIGNFIKKGENILLKPNLLVPSSPESAVTTHPAVFSAIAKILIEHGAEVTYGDSPSIGGMNLASKRAGLHAEAERLGIKRSDFRNTLDIPAPDGVQNKRFRIAKGVFEADGIINLPKMKPHGLMRITGAVKSMFGCLPGLQKAEYHWKFASRTDFAQLLVDLCGVLKPRLNIMDGIIAMEGEGPRSGDPKRMNVIIIGDDPVAVDSVFCRLIDLPPEYILTNTLGEKAGLGFYKPEEIEIAGDPLEKIIDPSYRIERKPVQETGKGASAKFLRNLFIPKPKINTLKCTYCGNCEMICPTVPKAITFKSPERSSAPVINHSNCIRCYCCHEVCPSRAISLRAAFRIKRRK